jgi:hypothetical protein
MPIFSSRRVYTQFEIIKLKLKFQASYWDMSAEGEAEVVGSAQSQQYPSRHTATKRAP